MTKIVVLDGYTLNPGDLSWEGLEALGECVVHDRSEPEEVVERAKDADVVLTNKTVLDRLTLADLPKLQYIGVLATGYNVVDIAATRERGIPVTNVPGYGTPSVAQYTMALILELAHRIGDHSISAKSGDWAKTSDFCYWNHPLIELRGLTLGIVGFGQIGSAVADLAMAFGMKVIVHNRSKPVPVPADIEFVELDALLERSDVVTLHCPLTDENLGFIDAEKLGQMKSTAFLVNTARGPLIDEQALADALEKGEIAGAAVDVVSSEPPTMDNPLFAAPNCIVTPHIAWATRSARARLMEIAVGNVKAFLNGKARNVVNKVS